MLAQLFDSIMLGEGIFARTDQGGAFERLFAGLMVRRLCASPRMQAGPTGPGLLAMDTRATQNKKKGYRSKSVTLGEGC